MFNVEVKRDDALLERILCSAPGKSYCIGYLPLHNSSIGHLVTDVVKDDRVLIYTKADTVQSRRSLDISEIDIRKRLEREGFKVQTSTVNVVAQKGKYTFHIEREIGDSHDKPRYTLFYVSTPVSEVEELHSLLCEYKTFLAQGLITVAEGLSETPCIEGLYSIGEDPISKKVWNEALGYENSTGNPRQSISKGGGDQELSLDQLEERIEVKELNVKFEDVIMSQDIVTRFKLIGMEIVEPYLAQFLASDPSEPRCYLVYGGSGCGKTMLVKALASDLKERFSDKVKLYLASYDALGSEWRGKEATTTRKLFELAKRNEDNGVHTLLFLDELQEIAMRHTRQGASQEALGSLLSRLGGMEEYRDLTVIGATYVVPSQLDVALIRRLSKHIYIPKPDEVQRAEIFRLYSEKMAALAISCPNPEFRNESLFGELDITRLAESAEDFTGDDIRRVLEEARDQVKVRAKHLLESGKSTSHVVDTIRASPITDRQLLDIIIDFSNRKKSGQRGVVGYHGTPKVTCASEADLVKL